MNLTVNDFFCGAGGMGVGFRNAGFEIKFACDFDKYCVETYRHNVGNHVVQADIKTLTYSDIPKASVWTFGFPCQDLSYAGGRAGFEFSCKECGTQWKHESGNRNLPICPKCGSDKFVAVTRSALFFEMMRLLEETKENAPDNLPMVLVAENVKGLKNYIEILREELLKHGYKAYVELYNSKYFDVAQNRERYYIVAVRKDLPDKFIMPDRQEDNPVPKLSEFLDTNVDEKFYIADDKAQAIIAQALERLDELGRVHATITPDRVNKRQNGRRSKPNEQEMFTLTAQDLHGLIIDDTYGFDGARVYDDLSPTLRSSRNGLKTVTAPNFAGGGTTCSRRKRKRLLCKYRNNCSKTSNKVYRIYGHKQLLLSKRLQGIWKSDDDCDTRNKARCSQMNDNEIKVLGTLDINGYEHGKRVHDIKGISPTLTAVSGGTHHIKIFDDDKYRVRKLTPKEYGRLQAFPVDEDWEQVVSNTQAYKQFGNAVTVNVAKSVANSIKEYLKSIE